MAILTTSKLENQLRPAILSHDASRAREVMETFLLASQPQLHLPGFEQTDAITNDRSTQQALAALRSIAQSFGIQRSSLVTAYGRYPDLGAVAYALAHIDPAQSLSNLRPRPFIPVLPARAKRFYSPIDAWERAGAGTWLLEPKWDGWACQIHASAGTIRLFGRSGRELTNMAPDVVRVARTWLQEREAIIESELIAINPTTGALLPGKDVRRPHVEHKAIAFDLLYLDGDCTHLEFEDRRRRLEELAKSCPDSFRIAGIEQVAIWSPEDFSSNFNKWQEAGFEGMVAKRPHAVYEANLRTNNLIKIKLKDTVDALIIGYNEAPRSYLAALWDEDLNEFVPFLWITPQKDILADLTEQLIASDLPPLTAGGRTTRVRLRPSLIVEVSGDKIFPTTNFSCGQHQTGQGWSLFDAALVTIRHDKSPADATTVSEFLEIQPMAGYARPTRIDNE